VCGSVLRSATNKTRRGSLIKRILTSDPDLDGVWDENVAPAPGFTFDSLLILPCVQSAGNRTRSFMDQWLKPFSRSAACLLLDYPIRVHIPNPARPRITGRAGTWPIAR
jgi:hypothetical protein